MILSPEEIRILTFGSDPTLGLEIRRYRPSITVLLVTSGLFAVKVLDRETILVFSIKGKSTKTKSSFIIIFLKTTLLPAGSNRFLKKPKIASTPTSSNNQGLA